MEPANPGVDESFRKKKDSRKMPSRASGKGKKKNECRNSRLARLAWSIGSIGYSTAASTVAPPNRRIELVSLSYWLNRYRSSEWCGAETYPSISPPSDRAGTLKMFHPHHRPLTQDTVHFNNNMSTKYILWYRVFAPKDDEMNQPSPREVGYARGDFPWKEYLALSAFDKSLGVVCHLPCIHQG